jgi:putative DNA primase/helicase
VDLATLLGRFKRVRRSGDGYVALCPAHDNRHPSLSITEGDGRMLVHCFRDCGIEAICDALGIRVNDLFSQRTHSQISDGARPTANNTR